MVDHISGEEEGEEGKKTNFFPVLYWAQKKSRGNEAKEIRLEKIFHYRRRCRVVFNIFYKVVPYRYSNTYRTYLLLHYNTIKGGQIMCM